MLNGELYAPPYPVGNCTYNVQGVAALLHHYFPNYYSQEYFRYPTGKDCALIFIPDNKNILPEIHQRIAWCVENNFTRIFLDLSWEVTYPFIVAPELSKVLRKYPQVKLLTHYEKHITNWFPKSQKKWGKLEKQIVNIDRFFEFEIRARQHTEMYSDKLEFFNRSVYDKQYRFGSLIGDLKKGKNVYFNASMHMSNLWKKGWWYGLNKPNRLELYKTDPTNHIEQYIYDNYDYLTTPKTYDIDPNNRAERNIPPFMNNCLVYIICEALGYPFFFTEKTYKAILAEVPFIFNGSQWQNKAFKSKGYEIFDNIFDFTYEKDDHWDHMWYEKSSDNFINELKKINKPFMVAHNEVITEKINHNRIHFLKRTTGKSLLKYLNRLIFS